MTRISLTASGREVTDAMLTAHEQVSATAARIVLCLREQRAKIDELTNERETALRQVRNMELELARSRRTVKALSDEMLAMKVLA